jgi:hypothetical protein
MRQKQLATICAAAPKQGPAAATLVSHVARCASRCRLSSGSRDGRLAARLCRVCGVAECPYCWSDPRQSVSTPGCRSRGGGAATRRRRPRRWCSGRTIRSGLVRATRLLRGPEDREVRRVADGAPASGLGFPMKTSEPTDGYSSLATSGESVWCSSSGEASGPFVPAPSGCTDRTHRCSILAEDVVVERDFGKRDEEEHGCEAAAHPERHLVAFG